jgi:hypothetical protein
VEINMKRESKVFEVILTFVFLICSFILIIGTFEIYKMQIDPIYNSSLAIRTNSQKELTDLVINQAYLRSKEFKNVFNYYYNYNKIDWASKNSNGDYVFYNNLTNETIIYDKDTMILEETFNGFYTLKDKKTLKVIKTNLSPEWNKKELNYFLNIAVRETRLFGNEGDPIIIDQTTKEILIDDSENCKDVPEVMLNGRRYMSLDWKHPNNMNPEASRWAVEKSLAWDYDSEWFYFFTEPGITIEQIENGYYKDFTKEIYKNSTSKGVEIGYTTVIKIPYEDFTMKLRVMFGAQAYEFIPNFSKTITSYEKLANSLNNGRVLFILLPILSNLIAIISLIWILADILTRKQCHKEEEEEFYGSSISFEDFKMKIKKMEEENKKTR